jgi:hypothetical protein
MQPSTPATPPNTILLLIGKCPAARPTSAYFFDNSVGISTPLLVIDENANANMLANIVRTPMAEKPGEEANLLDSQARLRAARSDRPAGGARDVHSREIDVVAVDATAIERVSGGFRRHIRN